LPGISADGSLDFGKGQERGKSMDEQCYKKEDSNPPICGVHNVQLIQKQAHEDLSISGLGIFTFLVCPKSGEVVREE
jgi:hypothetical protein